MSEFVEIGYISALHGVKGMAKCRLHASFDASSWTVGMPIRLGDEVVTRLESVSKLKQDELLVKLEYFQTKEQVQKGMTVSIDKGQLKKRDDEFFWHELIGFEVVQGDKVIGVVDSLLMNHKQPVIKVGNEHFNLLAPMVTVDFENKLIMVSELEYL